MMRISSWFGIVGAGLLLAGCTAATTEAAKSSNAKLSALTVDSGSLSPSFSATTTTYSVLLPSTVTSITATATRADTTATVAYSPSQTLTLTESPAALTVRVTAQDGTTALSYVVNVYTLGADITSATLGTLKSVPAGTFQRDLTTTNLSTISTAYWMSQYEITRAQFLAVMGSDPSVTASSTGTSDPVQSVSWYQAIAFCNKLSLAEGLTPVYSVSGVDFSTLTFAGIPTSKTATWDAVTLSATATGYRLPTEAEWMWAAMGATGTYAKAFAGEGTYHTVGTSTSKVAVGDCAVYGYASSGTGAASTDSSAPVGGKVPNELGLYDMSGNVTEWCWDWYNITIPSGTLTDYQGHSSGTYRVFRGGSWLSTATALGLNQRSYYYPFFSDSSYATYGFRVVRN